MCYASSPNLTPLQILNLSPSTYLHKALLQFSVQLTIFLIAAPSAMMHQNYLHFS